MSEYTIEGDDSMRWDVISDDKPKNPIVGTLPAPDGGTIRVYANGMVDAVDGSFYSISPGFDHLGEMIDWLEEGQRRYA
jgi:hypothetical protein